jgi:hypothetical protein
MSARRDHTGSAKVVKFHSASDLFSVGQDVYLTQDYYDDAKTNVLEVPRYGWQVKSVGNGVATIEYQRRNLKLLMSLMVETKYLTKEV